MHKLAERPVEALDIDTRRMAFEAIALRKTIVARYNRVTVTLAPHILYTRHGELYLDAVTVARDGRPPAEVKLGAFKLAGLTEMAFTGRTFDPKPIFNPEDPKYAGVTLLGVTAG